MNSLEQNWELLAQELGSALFIIAGIAILIILLILISMAKIYAKAGQPGWAAFVPVYSSIVLVNIIKKPMWWIIPLSILYWLANAFDSSLSSLFSLASSIFSIWATNLLVHKFGKTTGFTIGMIFLPFIFAPILAFGDAQYMDDEDVDVDAFGSKTPDSNLES